MFVNIINAELSEDRRYRYSLTRCWNQDLKIVNFICLNPSVADECTDDATVRRCIGFATAWGYGGIVVTNLFGLRSTDPRALKNHPDPIGPENDNYILKYATESDKVVCAWGNNGVYRCRHLDVISLLKNHFILSYLALTNSGQPCHPLRLSARLTPLIWTM